MLIAQVYTIDLIKWTFVQLFIQMADLAGERGSIQRIEIHLHLTLVTQFWYSMG